MITSGPLSILLSTIIIITLCACGGEDSLIDLSDPDRDILQAVLTIEDSRMVDNDEQMGKLVEGMRSGNSEVRRVTVRSMGRLERPDFIPDISKVLINDASPQVRAEAANALAQAVYRQPPDDVLSVLINGINTEKDEMVRGAIARSLGRLAYESEEDVRRAEEGLLDLTDVEQSTALEGVVKGYESLVRLNNEYQLSKESVSWLVLLSTASVAGREQVYEPFVRSTALKALASAGRVSSDQVKNLLQDPNEEVRRTAVAAVSGLEDSTQQQVLILSALRDESATVRIEAVRRYGGRLQSGFGCEPLIEAVGDQNPHVSLLAIDMLGNGCSGSDSHESTEDILSEICDRIAGVGDSDWHKPARALVALAKIAPKSVTTTTAGESHLVRYGKHPVWQVRMYAARAAAIAEASDVLLGFTSDPHHNVVQAALRGLNSVFGHQVDGAYVEALSSTDYQLVLTAARNLRGTKNRSAFPAMIAAFERISSERRDTSRDPRRALLDVIAELGDAENAATLEPYISDFDKVIADRVAEIIGNWTDKKIDSSPEPLPIDPFPDHQELSTLVDARAQFTMKGLGRFEIVLFPFDAPTVTIKFVRLVNAGYFDGLTFHRMAPNFVIQGGSPGANEFMGAEKYTRDEISRRSHRRGTLGISTRGRDTGDAQIFVNLVDNLRLDHNYTIFGEVAEGMDVVDNVLEGVVMEKVSIIYNDQ